MYCWIPRAIAEIVPVKKTGGAELYTLFIRIISSNFAPDFH